VRKVSSGLTAESVIFGNASTVGRKSTRKKGAYTAAEKQKRYRQKLKRSRPDPMILAKRQRRQDREVALAEKTKRAAETLGTRLYGVLYVDPPWDASFYSRETGMNRHPANHYPTMLLDELFALKLPAAKDCVLYLWAPFNQLGNAMDLIRAWGFVQKSAHVWAKDRLGTGFWARENGELLLVATRGTVPAPAPGEQFPYVIHAPRGEPSEKPEIFPRMIEKLWPNTPRLEMFAREKRDGWDSWGNEV
jgi:N6-adenosine-specific RNA methylase IME4